MPIPLTLIKDLGSISAASGLVRIEDSFYTVADDQLTLHSFGSGGDNFISSLPLFEGVLPSQHSERKKKKPDLESLILLKLGANSALLAVPSGSEKNRFRGALVYLGAENIPIEPAFTVDFSELYEHLRMYLADLNIEGAVATTTAILLFQRGNAKSKINAVISLDLSQFLVDITTGSISAGVFQSIRNYDLGSCNGSTYAFTDACLWTHSRVLYLAVAENTESTYSDGQYLGAAIGCLDQSGDIGFQEPLICEQKPEGLCLGFSIGEFFIVTDSDDHQKKSEFLKGHLPAENL